MNKKCVDLTFINNIFIRATNPSSHKNYLVIMMMMR